MTMDEATNFPPVEIKVSGTDRMFELDNPELPAWVKQESLASGNYPYKDKLPWKEYEKQLATLQLELIKIQTWMQASGERIVILFEGRDAAGKGGSIKTFTEYLNPRFARIVALAKPNDRERGEWYFQRYARQLPTSGELVLFDRSWYNRAGVEPVMGFCTEKQAEIFLQEAPRFEDMLVAEGIHLYKFWLNIGQEMQLKRFHDRRHDPLKVWKLSPIDHAALSKWDAYTQARNKMLAACHSDTAPWSVVRSNDKRRARINVIRRVLLSLDYPGKDKKAIGKVDDEILVSGEKFLKSKAL